MEEYKQRRRSTFGLDGDARVTEPAVVVALPARTVEYEGEEILYQREFTYPEERLSAEERRDRATEELVSEYAELAQQYGTDAPSLIDGEPRSVERNIHGILDNRGGSIASVFRVPDEVERTVIAEVEERSGWPARN